MTRGKDSEFDRLIHGEGDPRGSLASERQLLKFALDTFGESLSRILLAGLGEEGDEPRRQFTISYSSAESVTYQCRLQIITSEVAGGEYLLPRRRDPLVLLSLLQPLLHGTGDPGTELTFNPEDVVAALGWQDTDHARREVDEAIERYSALTYIWVLSGSGPAHKDRVKGMEQLFSNYQTVDEEAEGQGTPLRVLSCVVFNTFFINNLRRRTLFGVDWDRVTSIEAARG